MKMETPKMDVVRFQEADVLAASPIVTPFSAAVSNAGGKEKDLAMTITHNGNSYPYDYQGLLANQDSGILADVSFNNGSAIKTLSDLLDDDVNNEAFDGNYISYNGKAYTRQ